MKTTIMPAGVFKARCLAVMDQVQAKCETVIITKHGKPVARLIPADTDSDEIFGFLKGKIEISGDVVKPAFSARDWKRLK